MNVDLSKDPVFKSFFDKFSEHVKAIETFPLAEQRKLAADFLLKQIRCQEIVHHIEDLEIAGEENNKIPIRIYVPSSSVDLPVMLYFHGGGWVFGSIEESDAVCRRFANHLGSIVVSVGYRLAPEFPFPKPLEDCFAATKWVAENAQRFGGSSQKLILSGESAGGNLAGAVALMARDKHGPPIAAQLLLYPAISSSLQDAIYERCPDRYFMTKDLMQWFWNSYLQNSEDEKNPYASLDHAMLNHLPPALIVTAEYDPLSFEAAEYAKKLHNAGTRVLHKSYSGLIHAFLYTPLYEEKQKMQWTKEIGNALRGLID